LIQIETIQILDKLERSIRAREEGKFVPKHDALPANGALIGRPASSQMLAIPKDG
jgi:hypothetical protein